MSTSEGIEDATIHKRFSDLELGIMHTELQDLRVQFDAHVTSEAKKFDAMIEAVHLNTKAIDSLTHETKAIVNLHQDLQATARIGKTVQSGVLWLFKWSAIIGGILGAISIAIEWLLGLMGKP